MVNPPRGVQYLELPCAHQQRNFSHRFVSKALDFRCYLARTLRTRLPLYSSDRLRKCGCSQI